MATFWIFEEVEAEVEAESADEALEAWTERGWASAENVQVRSRKVIESLHLIGDRKEGDR